MLVRHHMDEYNNYFSDIQSLHQHNLLHIISYTQIAYVSIVPLECAQ